MQSLVEPVECAYCGHLIPRYEAEVVPAVDDDDAWEEFAQHHATDCEWVLTRAHRL